MPEEGTVLIVAFDGLDYDLIERWGLEHLQQEEFGRIDLSEDVEKIITWELFTTFLTGVPPEEHGITGKHPADQHPLLRFSDNLNKYRFFRKWAGLRTKLLSLFGVERKPVTKAALDHPTLFDEVPNSKALFVPVESPGSVGLDPWAVLDDDRYGDEEFQAVVEKEHLWRKTQFFDALEEDYNLLMVHFHKPDYLQHVYGDKDINYDEDVLKHTYEEMDALAAEIIETAGARYDTILFMSDHGLPTADQHNENAFYSLNWREKLKHTDLIQLHDVVKKRVVAEGSMPKQAEESGGERKRNEQIKGKLEDLGYI